VLLITPRASLWVWAKRLTGGSCGEGGSGAPAECRRRGARMRGTDAFFKRVWFKKARRAVLWQPAGAGVVNARGPAGAPSLAVRSVPRPPRPRARSLLLPQRPRAAALPTLPSSARRRPSLSPLPPISSSPRTVSRSSLPSRVGTKKDSSSFTKMSTKLMSRPSTPPFGVGCVWVGWGGAAGVRALGTAAAAARWRALARAAAADLGRCAPPPPPRPLRAPQERGGRPATRPPGAAPQARPPHLAGAQRRLEPSGDDDDAEDVSNDGHEDGQRHVALGAGDQ
jgi:hypothetical protein